MDDPEDRNRRRARHSPRPQSTAKQRLGGGWFALQAAAALAWWTAMILSPEFRVHFLPQDFPAEVLWALLPADAVLFFGGSTAVAIAFFNRWAAARPMAWLVIGATGYATLFCWGGFLATGQAVCGALCMTGALAGSCVAARWLP